MYTLDNQSLDMLRTHTVPIIFRPMFEASKKHFGDKKVVGVEVGTSAGINAEKVLKYWKEIEVLHCVDCWLTYKEYTDFIEDDDQTILRNYCMRIATDNPKMNIITDLSVEAAKKFEDKSVDFVYIDANHAYKYVKQDIDAWLPKVKNGGIIGGHDWDWTDVTDNRRLAVKDAVEETFGLASEGKVNYHVNVYEMDPVKNSARLDSDWWVFI